MRTQAHNHFLFIMVVIAALSCGFTGCDQNSSFSSLPVASSNSSLGTPGAPTPTLAPCTDDQGQSHQSGDTWTEQTPNSTTLSCADGSKLTQDMEASQEYQCNDGKVSSMGSSQNNPVPPMVSCPNSQLSAAFTAATVPAGTSAQLNVMSQDVAQLQYSCMTSSGSFVQSGSLVEGEASVTVPVNADTNCMISALGNNGVNLQVEASVAVDCGSQVKVGGSCQDFACTQVVALNMPAPGTQLNIPARSGAGTCYSLQLASAIPFGPSKLTPNHDPQVESRNHDINAGDPNLVWNPYLMSSSQLNFSLAGLRTVKLAGGLNTQSPILVDNFVLVGIYPTSALHPFTSNYYHAYGTEDSTITIAGISSILFQNNSIPLTPFAPGGTSTIAPLDLTTQLSAQTPYAIDVRAEDCGGSRQLSNLYLLFQ